MNRTALLMIAAMLLIISGLVLLGFEFHKTVTLVIDGTTTTVSTWSRTVGSLLVSLQIPLNPSDRIDPAREDTLHEGETVQISRAFPAAILADDEVVTVITAEKLAGNLLQQAGVKLYPGDILSVDGEEFPARGVLAGNKTHTLQVRRMIPITLNTPSGTQKLQSTAPTLGHALSEAGIVLSEADDLEPAASTPLNNPLTVWYKPARTLTIQANGDTFHINSAAATVGEALAEAGFALQGLDYSLPAASASLPKNGRIQVVRVQEIVQLSQEPIPFETEYQASAELEIDTQGLVQTGTYGILAQRVRIRYEDGQETGSSVDAEWLAQEPETRVVGYGTNITKKILKVPGGEIEYWRAVPMYATSYSPCRLGVPQCNDVTALGLKLQKGVAGVAKSWYAFTAGQQVYVPGYGSAIIADFGNGLPGKNLIDLGFSEADFEPWHQDVMVYFLWPPPPPEQIRYILP